MRALTETLGDAPARGELDLAALSFDDRAAVLLCCVEHYSHEEAALLLGTTSENVQSRLFAVNAGELAVRDLPRDGAAPTAVDRAPDTVVGRLRSLFRSDRV